MQVTIDGYDLPGRSFCDPTGAPYNDVRVGVQIRQDAEQLIPGDADSARWNLDIQIVVGDDGDLDFNGPSVHGKRDDRFLYLVWVNITETGDLKRFRRAKLMLNRIDAALVRSADHNGHQLVARVQLTNEHGAPRSARIDPPAIEWTVT